MLKAYVNCGNCGNKIYDMKVLKPIKDVVRSYDCKCPVCGQNLSTEFAIEIDRY